MSFFILSSRARERAPVRSKFAVSGFTHNENLVVIEIKAILAAILFPYIARARENARRSSCQSNLKQIGLGIQQYLQDFDEKYPSDRSTQATPVYFVAQLQPYVKSYQIFVCPSGVASTAWSDANNNPVYTSHYGYNYSSYSTGAGDGINSSQVASASLSVIMADNNAAQIAGVGTPRHLEGANYAYADGHVKWLQSSKTPCSTLSCP
jgi:prepilin-type processing-associated H-X9-DG protein